MTSQSPQLPNTNFPAMRVNLQKALDELYVGGSALVTAGGTADALTLTYDPAVLEYKAGLFLLFKASADNTGAVTVNVNTLGAKDIKHRNGDPLVASDIENTRVYQLAYDGTNFILLYRTADLDINALTPKTTLVDNDKGVLEDSEASKAKKSFSFLSVWNYIASKLFGTEKPTALEETDLFTIKSGTNYYNVPASEIGGGIELTANSVAGNPTTATADATSITLAANRLLGRGSTGNVAAISVSGGLSFSGTVLSSSTTPAFYSGSTIQNTNFPIGSYVALYTSFGNTKLNRSMTLYMQFGTNDVNAYTSGGTGSALTGTWVLRGRTTDPWGGLFQRRA